MTNRRSANGWNDAQAMVGEVIGRTVGADLVTLAGIRRKLEVIALDCPLHYDDACARAFGYRTVVSPVSMTRVWAVAANWVPGQVRPGRAPFRTMLPSADPPGHGDTVVAARVAAEHHEPIYPGDRISGTAVLRRVTPKTTRVGAGAFLEVETTFANQHERVVTVELATVFRFDRGHGGGADSAVERAPAAPAAGAPASRHGFGHVEGVLHHDDVAVGDPLPTVSVPITLQRLVMEAGANRDFSPWHFDDEVSRALGAPAPFANTTLIETLLEAAVRRWARLGGTIRRLEFAMRGRNCAGDVASVGGKVAATHASANGAGEVALDLWIDSSEGRTVSGSAIVSLPVRRSA
jgi:acyl dehydratase